MSTIEIGAGSSEKNYQLPAEETSKKGILSKGLHGIRKLASSKQKGPSFLEKAAPQDPMYAKTSHLELKVKNLTEKFQHRDRDAQNHAELLAIRKEIHEEILPETESAEIGGKLPSLLKKLTLMINETQDNTQKQELVEIRDNLQNANKVLLTGDTSNSKQILSQVTEQIAAFTDIQNQLLNIINGVQVDVAQLEKTKQDLNAKLEKLEKPFEGKKKITKAISYWKDKKELKAELKKIQVAEKQFQSIGATARKLELHIEKTQKKQILKDKTQELTKTAGPDVLAMQDLLDLVDKSHKPLLEIIFDKTTRSDVENSFNARDVAAIDKILASVQTRMENKGDPKLANLGQLEKILKETKTSIKNAFHLRLDHLDNIDLDDFAQHVETCAQPGVTALDKQILLKDSHDLYWQFHSPFDTQINFSDFIEMYEQFGVTAEDELELEINMRLIESKIEHLRNLKETIESWGHGEDYWKFQQSHPEDVEKIKMEFLKKEREKNAANLQNPQKVVILGAGPGGLIRSLVAGMKGFSVNLIEKRADFTRDNMVKIPNLPVLDYFGIRDRLLKDKQIHLTDEGTSLQIKDLQNALESCNKGLLGNVRSTSGEKVFIKETGYDLADIQVNITKDKKIETGCLIRKGEKAEWRPTDLIVDATGAGAATAEILGNERQVISSQDTMMIATVFKTTNAVQTASKEKGGMKNPFQVKLEIPGRQYELVLPTKKHQKKLMKLETQMREVKENLDKVKRSAQNLRKAHEKMELLRSSHYIGPDREYRLNQLNTLLPSYEKNLEKASESLKTLQNEILGKAGTLEQKAQERKKIREGELRTKYGVAHSEQNVAVKKRLVAELVVLEKNKELYDNHPILDQADALFSQLEDEKKSLVNTIAKAAGMKHGLSKDVVDKDMVMANNFRIQVTHRDPAVVVGECVVQQSGDALATPDPLSGTGCMTALKGATVFSKSLDDMANPRLTAQERFRDFTYGSTQQTEFLITKSLAMRTVGMVLDGRIKGPVRTIKELVNYKLRKKSSKNK